jgi:hypothetical protein
MPTAHIIPATIPEYALELLHCSIMNSNAILHSIGLAAVLYKSICTLHMHMTYQSRIVADVSSVAVDVAVVVVAVVVG